MLSCCYYYNILLILAVFGVSKLAHAESCWENWVQSDAAQRTSGAVVRIGAYSFLMGGTSNAAYDNCRNEYFNGESMATTPSTSSSSSLTAADWQRTLGSSRNCAADYVFTVVPVRMVEAFYESPIGKLTTGIHGRQYAAALQDQLFVCYACSWSLFNEPSGSLLSVAILPRGSFVETQRMPMPTVRSGATMVTFGTELIYVFGGILNTQSIDHVLVHNVSEPNGGSWIRIAATASSGPFPQDLCDCSGTASHEQIFLLNCLNCSTQTSLPYIYRFHPSNRSWSQPRRVPWTQKDQIGASNAVAVSQFAVTLWPNGVSSPHAFMYDMVLDTTWDYPVEKSPNLVQHSALLTVGPMIYAFGGNPANASGAANAGAVASAMAVKLIPGVPLNKNDSTLSLGDDLMLYANANCISNVETLRVAISPACTVDDFTLAIPAKPCSPTLVFDTEPIVPLLSTIPNPHLWICVTQGDCAMAGDPSERRQCVTSAGNVTDQTGCRWAGCCWTPDNHCYQPTSVRQSNKSLDAAYWYATSVDPIFLTNPWSTGKVVKSFYQQAWFKITAGVVGALLLYIVIICVWRQSNKSNSKRVQSLDTLLNSSEGSFGVFGKKYKVEKKIGQGGFGTVFLATRRSDNTKVAIKYIPCKDAKTRDNAIKEFDMSQTIQHPNKMDCLDLVVHWSEEVDQQQGDGTPKDRRTPTTSTGLLTSSLSDTASPLSGSSDSSGGISLTPANRFVCLVMPFYPEGDLRRFTLRYRDDHQGNLPALLILRLARQLLSVTSYLHALEPPIIHRDIKPENILVSDGGTNIILTDFGMAHYNTQTYMTTRAGTLHYAAPETWKRQYTSAVDVWSVGCVIYAVSTGYITKDTTRVMFDFVDDDDFEKQMKNDLAHLPMPFIRLILQMLDKDPRKRISASAASEKIVKIIGESIAHVTP